MKMKMTKMSKEEIKQLAEEISFRLLATRKHPEHEWLIERLDKIINKNQNKEDWSKEMEDILKDKLDKAPKKPTPPPPPPPRRIKEGREYPKPNPKAIKNKRT